MDDVLRSTCFIAMKVTAQEVFGGIMFNSLKSATPEQKLWTPAHELITPVEIIRGFASVIKKGIESN